MRNNILKRGGLGVLLVLLLVVGLTLPFFLTSVEKGNNPISDSSTSAVSAPVGTKITTEAELKAWLRGTAANGYLAPAGGGNTIHFTHDGNYMLATGRTLDGRGNYINLKTDTRVTVHVEMAILKLPVTADPTVFTTDYRGFKSNKSDAGKVDEQEGTTGNRTHYGTFLHLMQEGAVIKDTNFFYTTAMNYVFFSNLTTLNQGIIVGRNEGTLSNVTLDVRSMFYHNYNGWEAYNTVMVGGLAGYNSGDITNCKVIFGAGSSIGGHTKPNKRTRSRLYVGGVVGYNVGNITNNTVVFQNVAYGTNAPLFARADEYKEVGVGYAKSAASAGGIAGRNGAVGVIDGAFIDVQKSVTNAVGSLVDAYNGWNSDAFFVGMVLSGTAAGQLKNMYTNQNQTAVLYGVYHAAYAGSGSGFDLGGALHTVVTGASLAFDTTDVTNTNVILSVPQGAAGTGILWSVGTKSVYEQCLSSISMPKTDLPIGKVACFAGKSLKPAPRAVPADKLDYFYGNKHNFDWKSDLLGILAAGTDFEKNLLVTDYYTNVATGLDQRFTRRDLIDVGTYDFNIKKNDANGSLAYLDATNKELIKYDVIANHVDRERIKVHPREVTLTWVGFDGNFVYDGTNQIDKISATYQDIFYTTNGNVPANAVLETAQGGFTNYVKDGYTIIATFEKGNYIAKTYTTRQSMMKQAEYLIPQGELMLNPLTVQYDGLEHSLSLSKTGSTLTDITEILAGYANIHDQIPLKPVWTSSNNALTNVGDNIVTLDIVSDNPNYKPLEFNELTARLVVTPCPVVPIWIGRDYVYDGNDHKEDIKANFEDVNKAIQPLSIDIGSENKEFRNFRKNGYVFTAVLTPGQSNYTLKSGSEISKIYNIKKVLIDLNKVKWNTNALKFPYNNMPVDLHLTSLPSSIEASYQMSAVNGSELTDGLAVNVGTYKISASLSANPNIDTTGTAGFEGELTYTIDPIDYDFSLMRFTDRQIEYDGTVHTLSIPHSFMPIGLDGSMPKAVFSKSQFKDVADSSAVTVSFVVDGVKSKNYNAPKDVSYTANINILPNQVDVVWTGSDVTYDGINYMNTVSASYLDVNKVKIDATISIIGESEFKNYKEGGYYFFANIADANYIAKRSSLNTNDDGNAFRVYNINKAPVAISASDIVWTQTKDSISISFIEGLGGNIVCNSGELIGDGVLSNIAEMTEYVFTVNKIPTGEIAKNYTISGDLVVNITTYYTIADYNTQKSYIGKIDANSRMGIEELLLVYNKLNNESKTIKKDDIDAQIAAFNTIVNEINKEINDNVEVGNGASVPVGEAAAASMVATLGLIALAGVVLKKTGGLL